MSTDAVDGDTQGCERIVQRKLMRGNSAPPFVSVAGSASRGAVLPGRNDNDVASVASSESFVLYQISDQLLALEEARRSSPVVRKGKAIRNMSSQLYRRSCSDS